MGPGHLPEGRLWTRGTVLILPMLTAPPARPRLPHTLRVHVGRAGRPYLAFAAQAGLLQPRPDALDPAGVLRVAAGAPAGTLVLQHERVVHQACGGRGGSVRARRHAPGGRAGATPTCRADPESKAQSLDGGTGVPTAQRRGRAGDPDARVCSPPAWRSEPPAPRDGWRARGRMTSRPHRTQLSGCKRCGADVTEVRTMSTAVPAALASRVGCGWAGRCPLEPPSGARPQALRPPAPPPRSLPDSGVGILGRKRDSCQPLPPRLSWGRRAALDGTDGTVTTGNSGGRTSKRPGAGRAASLRAWGCAGRRAHRRGTWAPRPRPWTRAQLKKGTHEEGQSHYHCRPQGDPTWCQAEV